MTAPAAPAPAEPVEDVAAAAAADTTADAHATTARSRLRRWGPLAALVVVLFVLSYLLGRTPGSPLPYDPAATHSLGTKALMLVLDRVGADVRVLNDVPGDDIDTLLVFVDNFDQTSAEQVRQFARDGGVVVVTDPTGLLGQDLRTGPPTTVGMLDTTLERRCALPALAAAEAVVVGQGPTMFVPDGGTGCFTREDDTAWLIAQPMGEGHLVVTGGPGFVTNSLLAEADNAYVAVALLAPNPGTRVGVLSPRYVPAGGAAEETGLLDLIPQRLQLTALQLFGAFGLIVLWRARRLGKPVSEPQEVRLPGSELVVAVGNLLQRTGSTARAGELLREDLRRALSQRLGVPEQLAAAGLADAAAARADIPADEVLALLDGPLPATEAQLIETAQRAEAIRAALSTPASVAQTAGA